MEMLKSIKCKNFLNLKLVVFNAMIIIKFQCKDVYKIIKLFKTAKIFTKEIIIKI